MLNELSLESSMQDEGACAQALAGVLSPCTADGAHACRMMGHVHKPLRACRRPARLVARMRTCPSGHVLTLHG